MWLVVGLGNPGARYQRNRHNIGFMAADMLGSRHQLGAFRDKFGGEFASGLIGQDKVVLLKPMEYMNHSGFAVQRAASFFDIEPERVVVVHDEIDLDAGRVKLKLGGGHGGHNGLRSIIDQLGSKDFLRIRLGVGKPEVSDGSPAARDRRVAGYVLADFPADSGDDVDSMLRTATDATETILAHGITRAMNDFNTREAAAS